MTCPTCNDTAVTPRGTCWTCDATTRTPDRDLVQTRSERDALEALLDRYSLANVVEALACIAWAKADHVRTNWQDERLARAWDADACTLSAIVSRLKNGG